MSKFWLCIHSQRPCRSWNIACRCHSITFMKSWYEVSVLVGAALFLEGLGCKCARSDWQLFKDAWIFKSHAVTIELSCLQKQSYRFLSAAAQFFSLDSVHPTAWYHVPCCTTQHFIFKLTCSWFYIVSNWLWPISAAL